jgi:hypothetical protein
MPPQDDTTRDSVQPYAERWAAESPFLGEAAGEQQTPVIHPWYEAYTPFREEQELEEMYGPEAEEEDYSAELEGEEPDEEAYEPMDEASELYSERYFAELQDEEPDEQTYERLDEASELELYREPLTGEDEYLVTQLPGTDRLLQEHFESLVGEAKALLDEMASDLRRYDVAAMSEAEIDAVLDQYQPAGTQLPQGFDYLLDDIRDMARRVFKGAMNLTKLQAHQAGFQPISPFQYAFERKQDEIVEPEVEESGEFVDELEEETGRTIDLNRAVRENQRYGKQLGWQAHFDRIARLVGSTTPSPGGTEFAKRVADWQRSQGFREREVDGIIGPETWLRMLTEMKKRRIWPPCGAPQVVKEDPSALNVSPVGNLDYSGTPVRIRMAILEGESLPVAGTVFYPAERAGQGTPFNTRLAREGPVPIVFMAHGMSALFRDPQNKFEERLEDQPGGWTPIHSHKGYEYFQRLLAQMGIIAVSVDCKEINRRFPAGTSDVVSLRARLILESIRHFQSLRSGSGPIHKDLIDFSKVGLMGHSQGGEAAVVVPEDLARRRTDITDVGVKGVIALAPTNRSASSGQPRGFAFMTILPAGDGDEYKNSGAKFYDRAIPDPFKCQLYVHHAIHSSFNTEWSDEWERYSYIKEKERRSPPRPGRPPLGPPMKQGLPARMLRSDHEHILSVYGCAFFRKVLLDDHSLVKFLKGQELPPGVPIPWTHISFESKEGSLTVDDHENRDIHKNTLGQRTKQSGGLTAEEKEFAEGLTPTFFGATSGMIARSSSPTGQFRSPLVGNMDLTGHEIWIRAAEVYNRTSIPAGATGFKLGLEDSSGIIAFVDSDDVGALPRPFDRKAVDSPHLLIEETEQQKDFTKTMLKTLRFPVSCFKDSYPGLDTKKVRAIVLRLDRGDGRDLAFDQLQIVKP